MIIRQIHIEADYWPASSLQDTPHTREQIANVRKFIEAVQKLGEEMLPSYGAKLTVKEDREHSAARS